MLQPFRAGMKMSSYHGRWFLPSSVTVRRTLISLTAAWMTDSFYEWGVSKERDASPDLHALQDVALNKKGLPCAFSLVQSAFGELLQRTVQFMHCSTSLLQCQRKAWFILNHFLSSSSGALCHAHTIFVSGTNRGREIQVDFIFHYYTWTEMLKEYLFS